jgi:predicted DNA-binding transcriptional regulator AlpA
MNKIIRGAGSRAVPSPAKLDIASKARSEAARVQHSFLHPRPKAPIVQTPLVSTQLRRTQSLVATPAGTLGKSLRLSACVVPKQSSAQVAASVVEDGGVNGGRPEVTRLVAFEQSAPPPISNATIIATGRTPESSQENLQRADLMIENATKTTRSTEAAVNPFGAVPLLSEKQVAAMLGLEPPTLRNWRVKGQGPRFVRLSRRAVRYSRADVEEWVASRKRRSTSDGGGNYA